jgi:hypothetical protein
MTARADLPHSERHLRIEYRAPGRMARPEPPVTVAINALFWRHHLTADFAGLMILRVQV